MRYAVIRNRESNRDVALAAHDPATKRIVFKCRSTDWPLQAAFDTWADRTLIVHEPYLAGTNAIVVRRKITRSDARYLDHLLDRAIKRPYEVRDIGDAKSTSRLDSFADQKTDQLGGLA